MRGLSESSFEKKGWIWIIASKQILISWVERWLTEHRYSPRLEHETFFLVPGFHYEAERWGIQFVIDPKSFAERHSPFFGGSPVKTKQSKAKQMKLFPSAARTASHRSPSQTGYDGGGGGSGGGAERARGQNCLFQKISHHLIFYRKAGGKAVSQQVKTGFSYHPKVPRTVRLRWVSLFYLPKRKKKIEPIFAREWFIRFLLRDLSLPFERENDSETSNRSPGGRGGRDEGGKEGEQGWFKAP